MLWLRSLTNTSASVFSSDVRDGVDVIIGAIGHAGQNPENLFRLWGSRELAHDVLARKRPLALEMIQAVSDA